MIISTKPFFIPRFPTIALTVELWKKIKVKGIIWDNYVVVKFILLTKSCSLFSSIVSSSFSKSSIDLIGNILVYLGVWWRIALLMATVFSPSTSNKSEY